MDLSWCVLTALLHDPCSLAFPLILVHVICGAFHTYAYHKHSRITITLRAIVFLHTLEYNVDARV